MNGEQMKALRQRHGLSQDALGEILGVNGTYVSKLERGERRISDQAEAKLSEWDPASVEQLQAAPDDLPEPPYDPDGEPGDPPPAKPTAGARGRTRGRRKPAAKRPSHPKPPPDPRPQLTAVQREAATMLTTVIQGMEIPVPIAGVDGQTSSSFVVPGLCHAVYDYWCPQCAQVIGQAAPAFSSALVRAYPALAVMLARPGARAELAIVIVQSILIPCLLHHLHPLHAGNGGSPDAAAAAAADSSS